MDNLAQELRHAAEWTMPKPDLNKLLHKAAGEIERLQAVAASRRRKKDIAVAVRNEHARGLDYWRERAMAAETAMAGTKS